MIAIEVRLEAATPDAEGHIERMGRLAYGSPESPTLQGRYDWLRKRREAGEGDVFEHSAATFTITCSRVVSQEMERHRIASYTERSMRFREPHADEVIVPPEVRSDDLGEWLRDYADAWAKYEKWRKRYPRQTARYHLPLGTATEVACTWNFRQIMHILELRDVKAAQPEMQEVARQIREICIREWPGVFGHLKREQA